MLYRASKTDCDGCALKSRCCPKQAARKVPRSIHEGARDMARAIARSWEGHVSRRLRKKIEMLFAHLKRILKLDRLRLRGPNGARDEFLLAATAQNLRKLAKLIPMPHVKPACGSSSARPLTTPSPGWLNRLPTFFNRIGQTRPLSGVLATGPLLRFNTDVLMGRPFARPRWTTLHYMENGPGRRAGGAARSSSTSEPSFSPHISRGANNPRARIISVPPDGWMIHSVHTCSAATSRSSGRSPK